MNLPPENSTVKATIDLILNTSKATDGGIRLGPSTSIYSDICVNGMFLNYASYFQTDQRQLKDIIDCILNERMPDGGFNCRTTRSGATHSSMHTTLSVLEGIIEFLKAGYKYRKNELQNARKSAEEFLLLHSLFRSDRTGEVINKQFLKMPYPCRWKYDILRALDYFQYAKCKRDLRMDQAIRVLQKKRSKDGTWKLQAAHPGKVHFIMEQVGKPSRWNTLRAMRIFKQFKINEF